MERFYAGGFLYNPETGSVLLHKRDAQAKVNPNSWAFFGGLNEGNETPMQTFRREIQEELNLKVAETECIALTNYFNEALKTHRYVFYVISDVHKSDLVLGEGEGFDWIPLENVFGYVLTEKTVRDLKTFLDQLKQSQQP